jgi:hypothetical protein
VISTRVIKGTEGGRVTNCMGEATAAVEPGGPGHRTRQANVEAYNQLLRRLMEHDEVSPHGSSRTSCTRGLSELRRAREMLTKVALKPLV